MKIALIQMNAGENKEKNIANTIGFVNRAVRHKAKLIMLPEVFHYRGLNNKRRLFDEVAEKIPGPSLRPFMEIAQNHKVPILAGSIYEKGREPGDVFNTSVLIDQAGEIKARYRKKHLFKAQVGRKYIDESDYLKAGTRRKTLSIGKWKMGMSICYDLRFPEMYRGYFNAGCQILAVPAAFTQKTGKAHWEPLLRARAIENQCYVLAPNQVGPGGQGIWSYGHSMIVDPWGEVVARGSGDKEQIVFADIDFGKVTRIRKLLPMNQLNER